MPDYGKIVAIYESSFPEVERFPTWLLRLFSHFKGIYSLAFYDGDILCGFSYFLVNDETVFILFLAVNGEIRSRGYGSRIISWIKNEFPGRTIFLDAEKPDDHAPNNQQRLRRIGFYRRNGIVETGHCFTYDDVTYEILSADKDFSEADYNENLASHFKVFKKKRKR